MASDEELEKIKARRMAELQARQAQQEQINAAQQEAEAQKQVLMRKILTPEARQRLHNVRMVRPEFVEQLELQLIQLAQSGRINIPISDEMLKNLLAQIQSQQTKREINIRRR
jgi:programmed cell death protein 5